MPTMIVRGVRGELPPLVHPEIARDFVEISDVADAYLAAATSATQEPGEIFKVGTGTQTSVGEVVAIAQDVLGLEAVPKWASMPERAWDTSVWVADNAQIRRKLGWSQR